MMKKIFLFILIICCAITVFAQQGLSKTVLQQSTNLPIGSFGKFINKPSWRGITATYNYFVADNLSAGITAGYYDFYEKTGRRLYEINNTEVSAVKSHSVQLIPVMLRGGYNWIKEGSPVQPYISLGAGINFVTYEEWFGTLVDQKNGLRFIAAPEIGTRILFNKHSMIGADLSLRYNYTVFKYNNVNSLQTISLNLGLFWYNRQ
jgi:outer membrane protein W